MINKERLIKDFMTYVAIDSESLKEDQFHQYLIGVLTPLGFEIIPDDTGSKINSNSNNLIARRQGTLKGSTIGFCAHLDTVSPGVNIQPIIENGIIKSQGDTILAADDKSGIAIIIEIVKSAIENNQPLGPIELLFTISEEKGILGSKHIDASRLDAECYYILDATGDPGEVIIKGPSHNSLNITVQGLPAHAGLCPEEGINAIQVASHAISQIKQGRIDSETTANIGNINGGITTNIVCPEVKIVAEVRSLSTMKLEEQTAHMKNEFEKACDKFNATLNFEITRSYNAFSVSETAPLLEYTKNMIEKCNLPYSTASTGGGSDANNLNAKGIPSLIMSIGMKKCHTLEEHISIKDFVDSTNMMYELLINYWL